MTAPMRTQLNASNGTCYIGVTVTVHGQMNGIIEYLDSLTNI
jgi:hypothetical protein